MNVHELPNASHLRPQKLSGLQTPHVTIEPNTTCNIRCKFCYAIEQPLVKTLDEVKAEIDLACSKRELDAISLLGGEPTLHPDIVEIIRYIKGKGLICQLLTNGVRFLYHHDTELLDTLIDAGVDRVLVHVDTGQAHVHGDIDEARHRLASLFEARKLLFGMSITLYEGEERDLPRILCEYARYRYFDGVLITLAMDFHHAFVAEQKRQLEPDIALVAGALHDEMNLLPAAYLPSNLDDDEVTWLMYFYWINAETKQTFALSPEVNRAMKWLYRRTHAHEFFAESIDPDHKGPSLLASGVAELLMQPSRARELGELLREAGGIDKLRFHYAVIQQAPRMNVEHGKVQICWQCPDAVVRNGRLTPVCIAGRVNPLFGEPTAPREVVETVFEHLGEEPPA